MFPPAPTFVSSSLRVSTFARRRGYTFVELCVTVGVLIIVLGLARNLANRVRAEATDQLARQRLRLLTGLMDRYLAAHGGALPPIPPIVPDAAGPAGEAAAQAAARANNAALVRYLLSPAAAPADRRAAATLFDGLGPDRPPAELDDPWGRPIVFLPRQNPLIGMARDDRPFFVSAGPDRLFLTRQDNRYSYEEATPIDGPSAGTPPAGDAVRRWTR